MLRAIVVATSFALRTVTHQASDSLRLVVATGATCHSLPDESSPIAQRYHLGDVVGASKSTKGPGGRTWYFDSWRVMGISPTCWLPANATVPFSRDRPEQGFAAVAQYTLAHDTASFEALVDAENFLVEPNHYGTVGESPLPTSGLLQFRRLQLIERAAKLVDAHGLEDAPVKRAWVIAHRDVPYFFEPDARWFVANEKYWALYDANQRAPWAEELAAYAGQRVLPADECGSDCFLSMIAGGPQQYWTRLPNGPSIRKALSLALELADYAIKAIDEEAPTRAAIDSVRSSLARVGAPEQLALLDRLARLDRAVKP
jgi:hypothetical protein